MGYGRLAELVVPQIRRLTMVALVAITLSGPGWAQRDSAETARREAIARKATAAGLERYASRHLTLYTDIRDNRFIEELPAIFDLAVPQWREYLDVPKAKLADWHMTGFVMLDADRFRRLGLLPQDLPPFLHGYQRGTQFWVHEQPSDYYRRHLVLHEGTHGVMERLFRGGGPPWFMEGTAELHSTHRWKDGELQLRVVPDSKNAYPYLGRLKIIRDGQQRRVVPSMVEIMKYDHRAHLRVEPYAWSWALAVFLDSEPRTGASFRALAHKGNITIAQFSSEFFQQHKTEWRELENGWQAFVADLDYGSSPKHQIPTSRPRLRARDSVEATITSAHGWQATGILLEAGSTYRLSSSSRYQLGTEPSPWWCEPQGITIDYHRGRPIGMLLGALTPEPTNTLDRAEQGQGSFLEPLAIGREQTLKVEYPSRLYLKINEATGRLSDNVGTLKVLVEKQR